MKNIFFCIGSLNWDQYMLANGESVSFLGGSAANTCFFLLQLMKNTLYPLDYEVNLISTIGTDKLAEKIISALKSVEISAANIKILEGNSGRTEIRLDFQGERSIKRFPSVSSKLSEIICDSSYSKLLKNGLIHFNHSQKTLENLVQIQPHLFSMDISGILPKVDDLNDINKDYLRNALLSLFEKISLRILLGNEEEFGILFFLLGNVKTLKSFLILSTFEKLRILHDFIKIVNIGYLCMKCGKKGAILVDKKTYYFQKPPENLIIKDTTGAGDAFNAGIIFGILNSFSLERALNLAVFLGSKKCEVLGVPNFKFKPNKLLSSF
ncbi:MAG: carbohydrate kinase family protein [Candidatus Lokiarchaeota archaeon]|nr:carbohydrate kinase family protein [Candidatus Harpocratesius repetitus]